MNDWRPFENTGEDHLLIGMPGACLQRDYISKNWNYIPISKNPSPALNRECLEYYILLNCPHAKNEAMNGVRVFQGEWPLCYLALAAKRKYHRLVGLTNRNLFLTALEARSLDQDVCKDGSFSGL